jgi:hypothetical protein
MFTLVSIDMRLVSIDRVHRSLSLSLSTLHARLVTLLWIGSLIAVPPCKKVLALLARWKSNNPYLYQGSRSLVK